jgi:hypothetical protein
LLSGEDLTTEQIANHRRGERLGLASGDGVVRGLEVAAGSSTTSPTVTVRAGLAINRRGDAVSLENAVTVGLYAPASPAPNVAGVTPFGACGPAAPGVHLGAAGVYVLTLAPARGTQGRAPVLGLADGTDKCNANYIVEGVQFRLVQLPVTGADLANTAQLRSIVAAQCLGFTADPMIDPFGAPPAPAMIEALRPATITDAEVPLAVVGWAASAGITFVDVWSARRRLASPDAAADTVFPVSGRGLAVGEAVLLQFQDQLQSLLAGTPESTVATGVFRYLPAAGLLPLWSPSFVGFVQAAFFQGITVNGPIDIEGARVADVLRTSLRYPPVDLSNGEALWLFRTRQNAQSTTARPYVLFVSAQMPYFGEARFDCARFDFGAWA